VIVDDGLATGLTAQAAAAAVARQKPRRVTVAVPVAPPSAVREFAARGVVLEALQTPTPFEAVGRFYESFAPVEDDEVRALLGRPD
jgi:predicted phosphoribosyltransferase